MVAGLGVGAQVARAVVAAAQGGEGEHGEGRCVAQRAGKDAEVWPQAREGGLQVAEEQEQQQAREHRRGGQRFVSSGDVGGGLGDALAGPEDPAYELAVADLGGGREVEGLVRELRGGVVLAADGLLAGVVVDVLGAAAIFGGEGLETAVRVELPGACGDGALAGDAHELAGGVVGELLAAGVCDGVRLRAVIGQRDAREGEQVLVVRVRERLLAIGAGGVREAVEVVVREALGERGGLRRGASEVAGLGEETGDVVGVGEVQEFRVAAADLLGL